MKKILVMMSVVLICHLSADSLRKVSLLEYIEIVSFTTNKNIYISKEIENPIEISLFMPQDIKDSFVLLETLDKTLKDSGLKLQKLRNIYIVSNIKEIKYRFYKFKYINPKDIKEVLLIFGPDILFSYLSSSNTVVYNAPDDLHVKINNFLKLIDIPKLQTKVKLTIFITNISKLSALGTKIDGIKINLNNFLSSVISSTGVNTSYNASNTLSFKASLSYLEKKGVSTIEQSPVLTLRDGELSKISFVKTVPYQISTTSVSDGQSTTQEVTEYKDVGLIISIKPKIHELYTFLDFKFTSESLLDKGNKPTSQKITYEQKFKLLKDELLVLSGLTKKETFKDTQKVPILGDLPILKHIFKYEKDNTKTSIITIMIEHVK